jgi:Uma2 family endonuclease
MPALAQKLMTAEEFAVWAEACPEKHWELFEGVPQIQPPQNFGHGRTVQNIASLLYGAPLPEGRKLFAATRGLLVKAGPHTAFEPDVVAFSGHMDDYEIIVPEPLIVAEVLAADTQRTDLTVKLAGYFSVPSIEHYLAASWEEREIVYFRREGRGIAPPAILREGALWLDPPGIGIALADAFK